MIEVPGLRYLGTLGGGSDDDVKSWNTGSWGGGVIQVPKLMCLGILGVGVTTTGNPGTQG